MFLKLLCGENLPVVVVTSLQGRGFNAVRVRPGMADPEIASQAKHERRIILTFDCDLLIFLRIRREIFSALSASKSGRH